MNPRYLYLLFFVFLAACTGASQHVQAPAITTASACAGSTLERSGNVAGFGGCSHIFGDLRIENTRHGDLSMLAKLRSVSGTLLIAANPNLSSLKGLEGLSSAGHVVLLNNPRLADVSALSGLSEARAITVIGNPLLMALSGPDALRHLDGLVISDNAGLISLSGFAGSITAGDVVITDNPGLIHMSGLAKLTVAEHLYLEDNPRLAPTPKLFRSLARVEQELSIERCPGVERGDVIDAGQDGSVARWKTPASAPCGTDPAVVQNGFKAETVSIHRVEFATRTPTSRRVPTHHRSKNAFAQQKAIAFPWHCDESSADSALGEPAAGAQPARAGSGEKTSQQPVLWKP